MAYENDPRILAERKKEDDAHEAKKQAKKDAKEARYHEAKQAKVDEERKVIEAKEEEERIKKDETIKKREAGKLYRLSCKNFNIYCCEKMPGSKYDKWFIEEFVKKYKKQEDIDAVTEVVKAFDDKDFEN